MKSFTFLTVGFCESFFLFATNQSFNEKLDFISYPQLGHTGASHVIIKVISGITMNAAKKNNTIVDNTKLVIFMNLAIKSMILLV